MLGDVRCTDWKPAQIRTDSGGGADSAGLAQQDGFRKINIAATRKLGVDRTARIEVLHFAAGARAKRNTLVLQFAEQLDLALRPDSGDTEGRLRKELCAIYRAQTLETTKRSVEIPVKELLGHTGNTTTDRLRRNAKWSL